MRLHKEGRGFLISLFIILLAANLIIINLYHLSFFSILVVLLSLIYFAFFIQFFRNPIVIPTIDEKSIIAPADGKVVVIERVTLKEYLSGEYTQISIFMSPVNVHVNRTPVRGIVRYFKYHPGKYLVAWHPKSSTDNERTSMVLEYQPSRFVMVRQIAGAVARRIKYYVAEGDQVDQGMEYGFIKFGSRVDLFIPVEAVVKVAYQQATQGGKTIIATLP